MVVVVDGSGILHPRNAGLATMLGVLLDLPTVGVTKKRLCGQLRDGGPSWRRPAPVKVNGMPLGDAILPTRKTSQPLFVSPGHRIDRASSTELVESLLDGKHRLPVPIQLADRISRRAARNVPRYSSVLSPSI